MPLIPVVHAFNPKPREDYKTEGDSSQAQYHFETPGGRITIFWTEVEPVAGCFAFLTFRLNPNI